MAKILSPLAIAKEAVRLHAQAISRPLTRADYDAVEAIAWTLYCQSSVRSPFDLVQDHLWILMPEVQ